MKKNNLAEINIIGILKQALNSVDPRLMDHGDRVAYLMFKVLEPQKIFTDKELRDICILSMLHDIGAYETEEIERMVEFETCDVGEHSIFGYLFLKYFSPLTKLAPVILYHHSDCDEVKGLKDPQQQMLAQLLSLCDRADVFYRTQGTAGEFKKYLAEDRDRDFYGNIIDMFFDAKIDIDTAFENFNSDKAFRELFEKVPLSDEEIERYINTLVYSIDFRSRQTVMHTIYSISISLDIADMLDVPEKDIPRIKLGAVLHDIGKIGIPSEILESTEVLSGPEMEIMKTHTNVTEKILEGNVPDDIMQMAVNHHEKLNGTGYPRGLDYSKISLYDRIIAVADITSALNRDRNYKKAYPKDRVVAILEDMGGQNLIDPKIATLVAGNIDNILADMEKEAIPVIQSYMAINDEYERLIEKM